MQIAVTTGTSSNMTSLFTGELAVCYPADGNINPFKHCISGSDLMGRCTRGRIRLCTFARLALVERTEKVPLAMLTQLIFFAGRQHQCCTQAILRIPTSMWKWLAVQ